MHLRSCAAGHRRRRPPASPRRTWGPVRGGGEPAHRFVELAEFGPQIVLAVAATELPGHRRGGIAVQRADGAPGDSEDRTVHELRVVAVGLVLGQEFPVRPGAVAEPPDVEGDARWARAREPVDLAGRRAEVCASSEGPS